MDSIPTNESATAGEVSFGGSSLFGYTSAVREVSWVALKGDGVPTLRRGMIVELLGDSRGYVPAGFEPGESAVILGFREPFTHGESDHIVEISNGRRTGWVKPSNIRRNAGEQL